MGAPDNKPVKLIEVDSGCITPCPFRHWSEYDVDFVCGFHNGQFKAVSNGNVAARCPLKDQNYVIKLKATIV